MAGPNWVQEIIRGLAEENRAASNRGVRTPRLAGGTGLTGNETVVSTERDRGPYEGWSDAQILMYGDSSLPEFQEARGRQSTPSNDPDPAAGIRRGRGVFLDGQGPKVADVGVDPMEAQLEALIAAIPQVDRSVLGQFDAATDAVNAQLAEAQPYIEQLYADNIARRNRRETDLAAHVTQMDADLLNAMQGDLISAASQDRHLSDAEMNEYQRDIAESRGANQRSQDSFRAQNRANQHADAISALENQQSGALANAQLNADQALQAIGLKRTEAEAQLSQAEQQRNMQILGLRQDFANQQREAEASRVEAEAEAREKSALGPQEFLHSVLPGISQTHGPEAAEFGRLVNEFGDDPLSGGSLLEYINQNAAQYSQGYYLDENGEAQPAPGGAVNPQVLRYLASQYYSNPEGKWYPEDVERIASDFQNPDLRQGGVPRKIWDVLSGRSGL